MNQKVKKIIRSGKPFLIYHNEEDETAMVLPAEFITKEYYKILRAEATGDIALMFSSSDVEGFGIDFLSKQLLKAAETDDNVINAISESHAGPTMDLKISKTGSADSDKINTIKRFAELVALKDNESFFKEFLIPGHVRTYLADQDLLDGRIGHTELGVYLSKYAGLSGVVCMVTIRDRNTGIPLNLKESENFSKKNKYELFYENEVLDLYRKYYIPKNKTKSKTKDIDLLNEYKKIFEIREFEKLLLNLFKEKKIRGSYHLAIGQEATGVAIGNCVNLKLGDSVFVSHRGHHVALGLGLDYKKFFFECIGDKRGLNNGRSGPMHFFYKPKGLISANGIVAANSGISAGLALANKYNNSKNVVVNVIGEGSLDEGVVHETLTLAKIWELPLIIVCENNFYSQSTIEKDHLPHKRISTAIKNFYNIHVERIENGTDVVHLQKRLNNIVEYVRKHKKPVFVELHTYRFCGHSMSDKNQSYKDKDLNKKWQKRDPLVILKEYIMEKHKNGESFIKSIENGVVKKLKKLEKEI